MLTDTEVIGASAHPLPPVGRRTVTNHACGELDVRKVAELPQLLRGTAVLKDDRVGVEGVEFAGAKAVNGVAYTLDKFGQTSLVILRNCLACGPPLRLAGHASEATNPAAAGRYLDRHDLTAADADVLAPVELLYVVLHQEQRRASPGDPSEAGLGAAKTDPWLMRLVHVLLLMLLLVFIVIAFVFASSFGSPWKPGEETPATGSASQRALKRVAP